MENVGTGWFLSFSQEEADAIEKYLSAHDYPPGKDGVKQLLLHTILIDVNKLRNPILEAIQDNPEAVQATMQGIVSLGGKILNAKIFKKK